MSIFASIKRPAVCSTFSILRDTFKNPASLNKIWMRFAAHYFLGSLHRKWYYSILLSNMTIFSFLFLSRYSIHIRRLFFLVLKRFLRFQKLILLSITEWTSKMAGIDSCYFWRPCPIKHTSCH